MDATPGQDLAELLFDGEERIDETTVGNCRLVLTSHRLIAVRPDGDPRFRAIDRPNLLGVQFTSGGDSRPLDIAARAAALGFLLLVTGFVVPADALSASVDLPPDTPLSETLGTALVILDLVALLDDIMLAGGALALLVALAAFLRHRYTVERFVVVEVSGEDDLRLSPPEDDAVDSVHSLLAAGGDPLTTGSQPLDDVTPDDSESPGVEPAMSDSESLGDDPPSP